VIYQTRAAAIAAELAQKKHAAAEDAARTKHAAKKAHLLAWTTRLVTTTKSNPEGTRP